MLEISSYLESQLTMVLGLFSDILVLVIVIVFWKWFCKKDVSELGFKRKPALRDYSVGLVAGAMFFSAAYLLCVISGAADFSGLSADSDKWLLLLFFLGYIVQGAAEEVLCRGFIMCYIRQSGASAAVAAIVNSVLFSLIHITNSGVNILALFNLFLFGAMLSIYCIRIGSLWGACAFHTMWNFTQGNIWGISVSGNAKACSVFVSEVSDGLSWLNGGAFGLEGGLCVTAVLLLAIAVTALIPKKNSQ
ncbi:MAG: CPBP family intramembrane metalloprotease [Clostridiales bacterium]|nr:CPBP family intramembrane metalloprotease [Clostridiales bacterium]